MPDFNFKKEKPKKERAILPSTSAIPSAERLLQLYETDKRQFVQLAKSIGWKARALYANAVKNSARQKAEQYARMHAPRPPKAERDPVASLAHAAFRNVLEELAFLVDGYDEAAVQSLTMQADELVQFKITEDGQQIALKSSKAKRIYRRAYLMRALGAGGWKNGTPQVDVCKKAYEYLTSLLRGINFEVERDAVPETLQILDELMNPKDDFHLRQIYESYSSFYKEYMKAHGDFSRIPSGPLSSIQKIFADMRRGYNTRNEPSPLNQWSKFRIIDIDAILVANMLAMKNSFVSSWQGYTPLDGPTGPAEVYGVFVDGGGTWGDTSKGGIGPSFIYSSKARRRPRRYADDGSHGD